MRLRSLVVVVVTLAAVLAACGGGSKRHAATGSPQQPAGSAQAASNCTPADHYTVYVANRGDNTVTAFNDTTKVTEATIPVGKDPDAIAAAPDGSTVYVANRVSNTVTRIRTSDNTVVTPDIQTDPGGDARAIAVDPLGTYALVGNFGHNNVQRIDLTALPTPVVSGKVSVLPTHGPRGIAITSTGKSAYIAGGGSRSVARVDIGGPTTNDSFMLGNTISMAPPLPGTLNNGYGPAGIAIQSPDKAAFVADLGDDIVRAFPIPTDTPVTPYKYPPFPVPPSNDGPFDVAITKTGNTAYFSMLNGSRVIPFDLTGTPVAQTAIPTGPNPTGIALRPDDKRLYVALINSNKVLPIDLPPLASAPSPGLPKTVGTHPADVVIIKRCIPNTVDDTSSTSGSSSSTSSSSSSTSTTGQTNPTLHGLTSGCTEANKPIHDGFYTSGAMTGVTFLAGQTLEVGVTSITGAGSIAGQQVELDLNPHPTSNFTKLTSPVTADHAFLSYKFPVNWTGTASWGITPPQDTRGGDWEVDCTT